MRCEFGYCIVCDKEIASKCSGCSRRAPNGSYTEVQMNWSNGTKMQMAVCVECSPERIWKADKDAMTKAVWEAWDKTGQKYDKEIVLV